MAKKSILEREKKRLILVNKFKEKRFILKEQIKLSKNFNKIFEISKVLQKLPKNSSRIRLRNRCWKTGKPRGFYRFFGLCRNILREMAPLGFLPGLYKASW